MTLKYQPLKYRIFRKMMILKFTKNTRRIIRHCKMLKILKTYSKIEPQMKNTQLKRENY